MISNKSLTWDDIKKAVSTTKRSQKRIYMNQKAYDLLLKSIDFNPCNVVVNNYLPDDQAIVVQDYRTFLHPHS